MFSTGIFLAAAILGCKYFVDEFSFYNRLGAIDVSLANDLFDNSEWNYFTVRQQLIDTGNDPFGLANFPLTDSFDSIVGSQLLPQLHVKDSRPYLIMSHSRSSGICKDIMLIKYESSRSFSQSHLNSTGSTFADWTSDVKISSVTNLTNFLIPALTDALSDAAQTLCIYYSSSSLNNQTSEIHELAVFDVTNSNGTKVFVADFIVSPANVSVLLNGFQEILLGDYLSLGLMQTLTMNGDFFSEPFQLITTLSSESFDTFQGLQTVFIFTVLDKRTKELRVYDFSNLSPSNATSFSPLFYETDIEYFGTFMNANFFSLYYSSSNAVLDGETGCSVLTLKVKDMSSSSTAAASFELWINPLTLGPAPGKILYTNPRDSIKNVYGFQVCQPIDLATGVVNGIRSWFGPDRVYEYRVDVNISVANDGNVSTTSFVVITDVTTEREDPFLGPYATDPFVRLQKSLVNPVGGFVYSLASQQVPFFGQAGVRLQGVSWLVPGGAYPPLPMLYDPTAQMGQEQTQKERTLFFYEGDMSQSGVIVAAEGDWVQNRVYMLVLVNNEWCVFVLDSGVPVLRELREMNEIMWIILVSVIAVSLQLSLERFNRVYKILTQRNDQQAEIEMNEMSPDGRSRRSLSADSAAPESSSCCGCGDDTENLDSDQITNVVRLINVIQSDNFFTFSRCLDSSNVIHLLIVFLEFWQFCAFSFDPSIPWSSKGGVDKISSVSYLALVDIDGISKQFSVDINLSEVVLMSASGAMFFMSCCFLLTVSWLQASKVDRTKKHCKVFPRCSPCICCLPVVAISQLASVLFFPVLKVILTGLSCTIVRGNSPDSNVFAMLDTAVMECFSEVHLPIFAFSLLSFSLFLPMSIFMGPLLQVLNNTAEAKYQVQFLINLLLVKLVLTLVSTFFSNYQYVFVVSSLWGCLYLAYAAGKQRPSNIYIMNNLRCALYSAASWAAFCSLITMIVDDREHVLPVFFLYLGWCLICLIFVFSLIRMLRRSKRVVENTYCCGCCPRVWEEMIYALDWKNYINNNRDLKAFLKYKRVDQLRYSYQTVIDLSKKTQATESNPDNVPKKPRKSVAVVGRSASERNLNNVKKSPVSPARPSNSDVTAIPIQCGKCQSLLLIPETATKFECPRCFSINVRKKFKKGPGGV